MSKDTIRWGPSGPIAKSKAADHVPASLSSRIMKDGKPSGDRTRPKLQMRMKQLYSVASKAGKSKRRKMDKASLLLPSSTSATALETAERVVGKDEIQNENVVTLGSQNTPESKYGSSGDAPDLDMFDDEDDLFAAAIEKHENRMEIPTKCTAQELDARGLYMEVDAVSVAENSEIQHRLAAGASPPSQGCLFTCRNSSLSAFSFADSVSTAGVQSYLQSVIVKCTVKSVWCNDIIPYGSTAVAIFRGEWLQIPFEKSMKLKFFEVDPTTGRFLPKMTLPTLPLSNSDVLVIELGRRLGDDRILCTVAPDVLVSGTTVTDGLQCLRRSVLSTVVSSSDSANIHMMAGQCIHRVVQRSLLEMASSRAQPSQLDRSAVIRHLRDVSKQMLVEVGSAGITTAEWEEFLGISPTTNESFLDSIMTLINGFVKCSDHQPRLGLLGQSSSLRNSVAASTVDTGSTIVDVHDIEENVWSPHFGLKGKIDATVSVPVTGPVARRSIVPFELKTGRQLRHEGSVSHRAQTLLYTWLLQERYQGTGNHIVGSKGLLYYAQKSSPGPGGPGTSRLLSVEGSFGEMRSLLIIRNRIALSLNKWIDGSSSSLPPLLENPAVCRKCYKRSECMTVQKILEPDYDWSWLPDVASEVAGMGKDAVEYFTGWWERIHSEETCNRSSAVHPWKRSSEEMAKWALRLIDAKKIDDSSFEYTMSADLVDGYESPRFEPSDHVVIHAVTNTASGNSVEHYAVARGVVRKRSGQQVVIHSDDAFPYRYLKGEPAMQWVLSKSNSGTIFAMMRENLVKSTGVGDSLNPELFSLLVGTLAPTSEANVRPVPRQNDLNAVQNKVVQAFFSANHYFLVHGMPGCGKSHTLARSTRLLARSGRKVLLTSYTHTAVDHLVRKVVEDSGDEPLRILRLTKSNTDVADDVRKYTLHALDLETPDDIHRAVLNAQIIAVTCLSVNAYAKLLLMFNADWCIVDEAGQMTEPATIGPLLYARKFCLVGDHLQLAPLVKDKAQKSCGMGISLFERLVRFNESASSSAVIRMNVQYRMNDDLQKLSNYLTYDGALVCGSEKISSARISISNTGVDTVEMKLLGHDSSVVFADMDSLGDRGVEVRVGQNLYNPAEADVVAKLCQTLAATGSEVGVICLYRQQSVEIRKMLPESAYPHVEVDTVDRFQGRDKTCIILSLVRNNKEGECGALITDARRLNVAFTRAKCKLIVVGSQRMLRTAARQSGKDSIPEKLVSYMTSEHLFVPVDAGLTKGKGTDALVIDHKSI